MANKTGRYAFGRIDIDLDKLLREGARKKGIGYREYSRDLANEIKLMRHQLRKKRREINI